MSETPISAIASILRKAQGEINEAGEPIDVGEECSQLRRHFDAERAKVAELTSQIEYLTRFQEGFEVASPLATAKWLELIGELRAAHLELHCTENGYKRQEARAEAAEAKVARLLEAAIVALNYIESAEREVGIMSCGEALRRTLGPQGGAA